MPIEPRREVFNRTVHGARGLFAGIVLLYHVVNSGLPTWPLLQSAPIEFAFRTTEYGVELFFCISGFVIVGTSATRQEPTRVHDRSPDPHISGAVGHHLRHRRGCAGVPRPGL